MKILEREGKKINYLQILYASPFPAKEVKEILLKAKNIITIENNQGLMNGLITEKTGIIIPKKIMKYDGRWFIPSELAQKVKELM